MRFELVERAVRSLDLDPDIEHHSHRIACYATALGLHLDLSDEELLALHFGGYLHDVGKVAIPDALLVKPGPLTAAEFEQVKQHAVIGDRLCGVFGTASKARAIVRHHHERLDGSGYPDGLVGERIPLLAQIVSVADVFDALTTDRPYRSALPAPHAMQYLEEEAGLGRLSTRLVNAFVGLLRDRPGLWIEAGVQAAPRVARPRLSAAFLFSRSNQPTYRAALERH